MISEPLLLLEICVGKDMQPLLLLYEQFLDFN